MAKRIPIYSYCEYLPTTSGLLKICANEQGISAITFVMQEDAPAIGNAVTKEAKQQLSEYFDQQRKAFDLPLAPVGTQFQQNVWQQLCAIPYGETCSYADIAKQLNNPNAVRAVGSANGKNPISIVVPCHRVIGANGTLTGYAGGLTRKAALLTLENPNFTVPTGKLTT
ncbi:MAG: methylated-DNA--[protein]-cysteine S-methyltransferase [Paraglaciecola chathamensis]|jgi:methylated-DNA-[protein]-cysteine S-methyltransferase|uniref:Methylated-DNA--protein-cysteine methyltransferase n=1 Tax=Paraglaciecola agarilytica NO2 TaxID=1125747 RepID=A0ABQ0IDC2_9ALTE|nr:methylated-DNA--[protein]-cysteine S-methyltransferase [Paraglaciecola agarilytica]GAC07271.1 methylated-DNA-[protein]-cysteine S-methyltransferase [Paraglaciecola agarilytica NO2]